MYKGQYLICRTHLTTNDLFWVWRVKHNTGVNHPDFLPAEIKLRTWSLTSSSLFSFSGFLSLMRVGSELSSSRSRLYSVDLTGELSHLRRLLGNQLNNLNSKQKHASRPCAGKRAKIWIHDKFRICSWLAENNSLALIGYSLKNQLSQRKIPPTLKRARKVTWNKIRDCFSFSSAMTGKQQWQKFCWKPYGMGGLTRCKSIPHIHLPVGVASPKGSGAAYIGVTVDC